MELKIIVNRSVEKFIENKPCFKETVILSDHFNYNGMILTFKSIFGD